MAKDNQSDPNAPAVFNPQAVAVPPAPLTITLPQPANAAGPGPSSAPHRGVSDFAGGKTLGRDTMIKIIRRGESVLHNGTVYSREQDLPSEAELAEGDESREAEASASLDRQQQQIDAQRARLGRGRQAPKK